MGFDIAPVISAAPPTPSPPTKNLKKRKTTNRVEKIRKRRERRLRACGLVEAHEEGGKELPLGEAACNSSPVQIAHRNEVKEVDHEPKVGEGIQEFRPC